MDGVEGRCGGCKHWQTTSTDWRVRINLKLIEGETEESKYDHDSPYQERVRKAEQQYGRCQAVRLLEVWEDYDENELPEAFTKDASDYQADFYTKAEFGCVLHEPVDDTELSGDRVSES